MTEQRRPGAWRIVRALLSVAVIVAVFGFALPKIADFSEVWSTIAAMTWLELGTLALVSVWNIVTYWLVLNAALPGSTIWQNALVNQASTAVSNTLPAGGAFGVAVTYAMYLSFGLTAGAITLAILITGIWNNVVKFGLPIVALGLLAVAGDATGALLVAALIGLVALAAAVVLGVLVLVSDRLAATVGAGLGRAAGPLLRLLRRRPPDRWDEAAVRGRARVIDLLRGRWVVLTVATLVSHLSLYLVLLVALRHVGVSEDEVSWMQVLAAFSFGRLVTALPITPGGLGVVELALTGALVAAGGDAAPVAAAVLVYRALTFLPPILFGAPAYLLWRRTRHPDAVPARAAVPVGAAG
jgi:putative heme transporter